MSASVAHRATFNASAMMPTDGRRVAWRGLDTSLTRHIDELTCLAGECSIRSETRQHQAHPKSVPGPG
ncbi:MULTISPECIES: hypothetical protein [Amycolatopsis]|uniref:Uncharacterized protein n=1 Tax=Amycolatopsis albidoflavus TaxID=102226 RepID=A0ABW5I1Y1_9PSEU